MRALLLVLLALPAVASAAAPVAYVDVVNNAFVDGASGTSVTRVAPGTTVLWTVQEGGHTVTARLGTFGTGNMVRGETYAYTFELPGVHAYHCRWHPGMDGLVIVA